jgi:hypothetical protein
MANLPKVLSIKMDLHNLLYVSYLVPVDRIRLLVPSELKLASFNHKVFVSIVAMQCRRVHLFDLKWPSLSYDQLNLRTYVIDPKTGKPAVYFFKSGYLRESYQQQHASLAYPGRTYPLTSSQNVPPMEPTSIEQWATGTAKSRF